MRPNQKAITVAVCLLGVTLFAGCSATAEEATPVTAANEFYALYAKQPFTGLPTGEAWNRIASHMSASLSSLIVAAQTEQLRCQKEHPGDKPPWIEGDMFSSNFEGFTRFAVVDSGTISGSRSTVSIDFEFVKDEQRTAWRDQVAVVQENGHWLIDDVRYSQRGGFSNGFGESLTSAIRPGGGC